MDSSQSQETAAGPQPTAASSSNSQPSTADASATSVAYVPSVVNSDTGVPVNAAPTSAGIPPGHKLVKTHKEDGNFVTEMRKMSSQEVKSAASNRTTSQIGQEVAPPKFIVSQGIQYKIITVRDSNGVVRQMKRRVGPQDSSSTTKDPASRDKTKSQSSPVAKPNTKARSSSTTPNSATQTEQPKIPSRADDTAAISPIASTPGGPTVLLEESLDMEAALADQKEAHRQKRTRRMKRSLIRGLGTIVGSSVGRMNLDMDHEIHGAHNDGDGVDMDSDGQAWSSADEDNHHEHDGHGESTHGKLPSHVKQGSKQECH